MASTNVVNLNTYTSKRVVVTNATAPAVSTSQVFYPIFSNSTTTGSQDLRNTDRVYLWEDSASSYFNVGNDNTNGGLTLHNSAFYVNIVPTTLTTTRTLTIPNLSGTICLTEGMPSLSIGQRETTTDPSTLTYSDRISIIPYFHIGGPWKIKSADDATNAHLALFYGNTELLRIRHDGTQLIDWNGNAATATQLETAGTTAQFYRGDRTWSSTISGGTLTCIPGTSTDATQMAFNGGIQVREAGGVGNAQSALVYAPRISFHWGNRTAKSISLHSDGIFYFRDQNGTDRSSIDANLVGNAATATQSQYLMNRGGTTVSIGDSTWAIQFTPSGHTNRATVFTQKWTQSGLTYTPSGGSATAISDTADFKIWLSSSNTSNALQANMQIDGQIYSLAGFKGNLTGNVTGDCSGSSGSCTGNAATATTASKLGTNAGNVNTPVYFSGGVPVATNNKLGAQSANGYWGMGSADNAFNVWIRTTTQGIIPYQSGGVGSGHCSLGTSSWFFSTSYIDSMHTHQLIVEGATTATMTAASTNPRVTFQENTGTQPVHLLYCDWDSYRAPAGLKVIGGASATPAWFEVEGHIYASAVHSAVWNDYAECRHSNELEPGRCVTETSTINGMIRTTERLMPGCKLISDTYGTLMGETNDAKTPIAVSGRVLAYPYREKKEYSLGAAVCSAPNGTVDIMTREEIMKYPERIVGTVSEIPTYEIWSGGAQNSNDDIQVNGRIWIYVR